MLNGLTGKGLRKACKEWSIDQEKCRPINTQSVDSGIKQRI